MFNIRCPFRLLVTCFDPSSFVFILQGLIDIAWYFSFVFLQISLEKKMDHVIDYRHPKQSPSALCLWLDILYPILES
jgi:hypothetical protein